MTQHFNPFEEVDPSPELLEAVSTPDDILTFEDYEADALSTVRSPIAGQSEMGKLVGSGPYWFAHVTYKLGGESGEFMEHVGKAMRDDGFVLTDLKTLTPERRLALIKELGDILWYVVIAARLLGVSLLEVARVNVFKRRGRKQRGTLLGSGDNR